MYPMPPWPVVPVSMVTISTQTLSISATSWQGGATGVQGRRRGPTDLLEHNSRAPLQPLDMPAMSRKGELGIAEKHQGGGGRQRPHPSRLPDTPSRTHPSVTITAINTHQLTASRCWLAQC